MLYVKGRVAPTTQNDGVVMSQPYNTFVKFSGQTGLYFKDITTVSSISEYTLSLWFRLQATPDEISSNMQLISAKPKAFDCILTRTENIQCSSDSSGSSYSLDADFRKLNWYMMIIKSKKSYSEFQIRELSFNLFDSDSTKSFFPFGQSSLTFTQLTLGMKNDFKNYGFVGNIRNFKLLQMYVNDDANIKKYQYIYLYNYANLVFQVMLNGLDSTYDLNGGSLVGPTKQLTKEYDYTGAIQCFTPQQYDFVEFSDGFDGFDDISVSDSEYYTSLQMWIYRKSVSQLYNDEFIFEHSQLLRLSFYTWQTSDLEVRNLNHEDVPLTLSNVPYNRWIFVQVQNDVSYLIASFYEIDGTQYSLTSTNYDSTYLSGGSVTIGKNFNGYIQGVKYYKQSSVTGMNTFQPSSINNALLYYLFSTQGVSNKKFKNYASSSSASDISSTSNSISWEKDFYSPVGDKNGTFYGSLLFDGVTCSDLKTKLKFTSAKSYVSRTISMNSTLNNYSVEFWVRPTDSIKNAAFMLGIAYTSQSRIYTAIYQDSDRALYCSPFYSSTTGAKQPLEYSDYSYSSEQWTHISCVYDGPNKLLKSFIQYGTINNAYFIDLTTTADLPYQSLTMTINVNPLTMSGGISEAWYSEVRFWSYARTQSQIQTTRFQQLDIIVERPNLYAYLKLLSGYYDSSQSKPIQEIDYSDNQLSTTATVNSVSWVANSETTICPLAMFRGDWNDPNCYREGIITFQLIIYKTTTSYVISSALQRYRSSYVRDNAYTIFNYTWSLNSTDSSNSSNQRVFPNYFRTQNTKQNLEFGFDQVSNNPGKYVLSLKMVDKRNQQQIYTGSVNFKTYQCANIFDLQTSLSYVYKDMESTKGEQDIYFYYNYKECSNYKFDQSSMTFTIDTTAGLNLPTGDHDTSAKSYKIKKVLQSYLPSNEYFYFKIKGVWRNTKDNSDTIEYYLVYACRFVSKLVVSLQPNYQLILKGQTLIVDYSYQFYNMKTVISNPQITVNWTCPEKIQVFCSSQTGSLKLYYENVIENITYVEPQTITMTAYTNFIQGDGLKYSNKSISIVWLDINPDANLVVNTDPINKFNHLTFQININSLAESLISLKWTSSPSVNSSCQVNSNDRKQFVINKNCLSEGTTYNATCSITYNDYNQVIWASSITATVPRKPSGGTVTCTPTTAKAYIDNVRCTTSGWTIYSGTGKYQYFTKDKNGNLTAISSLSTTSTFTGSLPNTTIIVVKVIDSNEAYATAQTTVSITFQNSTAFYSKVIDLLSTTASTKTIGTTQMMQNMTWITNALISSNGSGLFDEITLNNTLLEMSTNILYQANNMNAFSVDGKRYFIQSSVQIAQQLTNTFPNNVNFKILNYLQQSIAIGINQTSQISVLFTDSDFQRNFFNSQSNVLGILKQMRSKGVITAYNNTDTDLSNITLQLRKTLVAYEQYVSTRLFENEVFMYNTTNLNFSVKKYSRMAADNTDVYQNVSRLSYQFPLSTAIEMTDRQTFTSITFRNNPFTGYNYLNQSAQSDAAVYFAYRDQYGNYLNKNNITGKIKMVYSYQYSPFIFLPNTTVCGYIGVNDPHWENKSCSTVTNRAENIITCYCDHMSYYSIIDDYLERPQRIPLIQLLFKNWASFIVLLYLLMTFIIGFIYTYNKDNQDFRYLHNQEEAQGNHLLSDESIGLVSVAFKRKVFFMDFSERYRFCTLYRIFIMLLHPIFQLKYRMDPQIPRFYRFMLLYTRIVIMFGIAFFILKDYQRLELLKGTPEFSKALIGLIVFSIVGSLIFVPLPIFLLSIVKSKYYLLDPKALKNQDLDDPNYDFPITDMHIDMSIPIKLLFLVNAVSHEKIEKEYDNKLAYASGNLVAVGKKLQELDFDAKRKNEEEEQEKIKERNEKMENEKTQTERKGLVDNVLSQPAETIRVNDIEVVYEESSQMNRKNKKNSDFLSHTQQMNHKEHSTFMNNQYSQASPNKTFQKMIDVSQIEEEGLPQARQQPFQPQNDQSSFVIHPQLVNGPTPNFPYETSFNDENFQVDEDSQNFRRKDIHYEGGTMEGDNGRQNSELRPEESESNFSIDTNLFLDEKKELIEERNFCGRLFFNFIALLINGGIIIGMLAIYVRDGYYNEDNLYVWVVSFFGSQLIGLFLTDFIAILFLALFVSKWCQRSKVCLNMFMRESLYIYEDYKYVVQFVQTKIS